MFQSSRPVSGAIFHDRAVELARLREHLDAVRAGGARWLAVLGPRKIGKTSLLLELSRRVGDLTIVAIDTQEVSPPSLEVFRVAALRAVDALLGSELGQSLEILAATGGDVTPSLDGSPRFGALPTSLKTAIRALPRGEMTDDFARLCLDLPERLAEALRTTLVVAVDEFQELATLPKRIADPLPLIRSVWQRHRRVAYIVSGSGRTLLEEMVTREHSPFFQHFDLMRIGPFAVADAIELLRAEAPPERPIPEALARRAVEILGGHPFYLQIFGEALVSSPPPYDDAALKDALQSVLFSRTGRLALYFQLTYERAVGRSTQLAATLDALAAGPIRLSAIARALGIGAADVARYLERLGDLVEKRPDGAYQVEDRVFALWVRWRRPGGAAVPMSIVGDAAERDVADHLARRGFDLVYQSRASRSAFDLLATRGAAQLGVQVKRSPLPLRFGSAEWKRMAADAKRLGWRWVVASVGPEGDVRFLDPQKVRRGKELRLGDSAMIESLVEWLER